jgi:hypothetical protein
MMRPPASPEASLEWCARHIVYLRGESRLRAVMTGTAGRGKGVHREVESEGGA